MKNHRTNLEQSREKILKQGILTEANIDFYADIFDYQFNTSALWEASIPSMQIPDDITGPVLNPSSIGTDLLSNELMLSSLTGLAAIIHKHNPGMNFDHAIDIIKNTPGNISLIIESLLSTDTAKLEPLSVSAKLGLDEFLFLAVNWLKPLFTALREKNYTADPEIHKERKCPFCGYHPDMALYSGEKEGKRYLRCGLCENIWAYPRISCAVCGESNQKKLEIFTEEGNDRYRIDACHTCNGYIKSVRLNKLDETESCDLSVENLLTLSFDAEMIDKGFNRP